MVIAGNDRGKSGKILGVQGEKVIVQGVNVRKKHMRKSQAHPKGQIIDIERPVHRSNVRQAVDGEPVKVRSKVGEDGHRELYYLDKNGQPKTLRRFRGK